MNPVAFFAEISNIMQQTCKPNVYRDEPLTDDEIDIIVDRVTQLGERTKSNGNRARNQAQTPAQA